MFEGERYVTDPREHARQLHEGGLGIVVLGRKGNGGGWFERRYPVEVGIEVARHHAGKQNVYLSMQRFRHGRCLAELLTLSSMYVDVDFYGRAQYQGWHPYQVLEAVMQTTDAAGIPRPTLAIASGKGLYVVWQHGPVPRQALPRWQRAQQELCELLKPYGADPASKDAARVLRMIGTRNDSETVYGLLPVGEVYAFDQLADAVLPHTRAELHDLRIQRALRAGRSPAEARRRAPEGFTAQTLHERRLTDLQALWEARGYGLLRPHDHRHRWLFYAASSMGWLATDARVYRREVASLAADIGGWRERRAMVDLGSVIRRVEAAFRGATVEYMGEAVDPRYRATNQRIIEDLEIEPDEERAMRTIIGADECRRRDREDKERQRRAAGMMERQQYEGRARQRREDARRMAAAGKTRREIAEALDLHPKTVQRYMR